MPYARPSKTDKKNVAKCDSQRDKGRPNTRRRTLVASTNRSHEESDDKEFHPQSSFELEVDSSDSDSDSDCRSVRDDDAEGNSAGNHGEENGGEGDGESSIEIDVESNIDDVPTQNQEPERIVTRAGNATDTTNKKRVEKTQTGPPTEKKARLHSTSSRAPIKPRDGTEITSGDDVGRASLCLNASVRMNTSKSGSELEARLSSQGDQVTLLRNEIALLRNLLNESFIGLKEYIDVRLSANSGLLSKSLEEVKELHAVHDLSVVDPKNKKDTWKRSELDLPFSNFVFSDEIMQVVLEKCTIGHVSSTAIGYKSQK